MGLKAADGGRCSSVAGREVQHDPNPHQHGGSLHLGGSGEFCCDTRPLTFVFPAR